jgi:hypothetical protein
MAIRATYELEYSPPLDWAFFLRYLGVRATPGVETVENGRYIRTLATGRSAGTLCVSHHPTAARLVVATDGDATAEAGPIARRIRRMFDLDADLPSIHRRLGADPRLKSLLVGPITDSAAVSIIWRETLLASRFLSSSPRIAQDLCFSSSCSRERGHDSSPFDASVDPTEARKRSLPAHRERIERPCANIMAADVRRSGLGRRGMAIS